MSPGVLGMGPGESCASLDTRGWDPGAAHHHGPGQGVAELALQGLVGEEGPQVLAQAQPHQGDVEDEHTDDSPHDVGGDEGQGRQEVRPADRHSEDDQHDGQDELSDVPAPIDPIADEDIVWTGMVFRHRLVLCLVAGIALANLRLFAGQDWLESVPASLFGLLAGGSGDGLLRR